MAHSALKSLLGKRSEILAWFNAQAGMNAAGLSIRDNQDFLLFGNGSPGTTNSPILVGEQIEGWVSGDANAAMFANLLSIFLQKEAEKKKLGAEVLGLYQELNVIYNFSEKLTQTIEPEIIAQLTLEQAMHSIPSNSGVIVLWDEAQRRLITLATSGEELFRTDNLSANASLLLKIGLSGQSEIMNDISALKEVDIITNEVQSIIYAAMKVKHRIMGAIILAGKVSDQYAAGHLKLLVTLALQSSTAIESAMLYEKNIREVREREEAILRIHEVTKKFVPHEFIRSLGKESLTDVLLGDQVEKNVTVLFTDIRDFTTLSEKMTPGENFRFVSSFNAQLGPIIRSHHGFINQYLGDSIMALFPEHPEDALKAAIAMQKAIHELNTDRISKGLPPIKAGIGMHTGPLIMGITGDDDRLDAATISDTVNTASRIESLTKYYKSPLLLSEETLKFISEPTPYQFRHLGKVQLKGKKNALTIFECLDGNTSESLEIKKSNQLHFNKAMTAYLMQDFENAVTYFEAIVDADPDDQTALYFLHNAKKYQRQGVPENWSGAEEMQTK